MEFIKDQGRLPARPKTVNGTAKSQVTGKGTPSRRKTRRIVDTDKRIPYS